MLELIQMFVKYLSGSVHGCTSTASLVMFVNPIPKLADAACYQGSSRCHSVKIEFVTEAQATVVETQQTLLMVTIAVLKKSS